MMSKWSVDGLKVFKAQVNIVEINLWLRFGTAGCMF